MSIAKALHKQKPKTQRTVHMGTFVFFLTDKYTLSFQPLANNEDETPYLLTQAQTLALANLLISNYKSIVEVAKPHVYVGKAGHAEENNSIWK